jgi:thiamine-monophosphate kinase
LKADARNEEKIIAYLAKTVRAYSRVITGIGDDAAVLPFDATRHLLYTCDMVVEGTHFTRSASARSIGHKALACAVSDIAAMGGTARYALISMGLPRRTRFSFVKGLYQGIEGVARACGLSVVGGDTVRSERIVLDAAVIGFVAKKDLVLRSGARPGDCIFTTGALGGSLYGRHLRFMPRIKEAQYLVGNYSVHSMIDISDGLAHDLRRLTRASNVGALLFEPFIPVSKDAKRGDEPLLMGEDFELLFTVSSKEAKRLMRSRLPGFTLIGIIKDKRFGLKIQDHTGAIRQLPCGGFEHFQ